MEYRPSDTIKDPATYAELLKISAVLQTLLRGSMEVRYVAPTRPSDGDSMVCDGVEWNPLGDGIKRPIWFNETTGNWTAF